MSIPSLPASSARSGLILLISAGIMTILGATAEAQDPVTSGAHIHFQIQPGPPAADEHYSTVFVESAGAKVASAYTNFASLDILPVPDGHYTLVLAPSTMEGVYAAQPCRS